MMVHWLTHPKRSELTYLHFEPFGEDLVYVFGVVSMTGLVNGVFDKDYARSLYQQATRDGYKPKTPSVVDQCSVCGHFRLLLSQYGCGWCNNLSGGGFVESYRVRTQEGYRKMEFPI